MENLSRFLNILFITILYFHTGQRDFNAQGQTVAAQDPTSLEKVKSDWEKIKSADDIEVYNKKITGSSLLAFKATGILESFLPQSISPFEQT